MACTGTEFTRVQGAVCSDYSGTAIRTDTTGHICFIHPSSRRWKCTINGDGVPRPDNSRLFLYHMTSEQICTSVLLLRTHGDRFPFPIADSFDSLGILWQCMFSANSAVTSFTLLRATSTLTKDQDLTRIQLSKFNVGTVCTYCSDSATVVAKSGYVKPYPETVWTQSSDQCKIDSDIWNLAPKFYVCVYVCTRLYTTTCPHLPHNHVHYDVTMQDWADVPSIRRVSIAEGKCFAFFSKLLLTINTQDGSEGGKWVRKKT